MSTRQPKDILDIKALEDKIDHSKIAEMSKYHTTLKIVKLEEIRQGEHSMLDSAIKATEANTRTGAINGQAQTIKSIEQSKIQNQKLLKDIDRQS